MADHAAITVMRPREEVEALWQTPQLRPEYIEAADTAVSFREAPGDRGTEIHVDLQRSTPGGKLGEAVQKLLGTEPIAKIKDDLTSWESLWNPAYKGRILMLDDIREAFAVAAFRLGLDPNTKSDADLDKMATMLKQRPAQPLDEHELEKAGV